MFYRHEEFDTLLIHQCEHAQRHNERSRQDFANIRKQENLIYFSMPVRDNTQRQDNERDFPVIGHEYVSIRFCPFCGCNLKKEKIAEDVLDLPLF